MFQLYSGSQMLYFKHKLTALSEYTNCERFEIVNIYKRKLIQGMNTMCEVLLRFFLICFYNVDYFLDN